ncbi:AAA family ATPase [Streptomyces parvus]|uniref:transposase n=3 Tax=Streptomyces parvus TaxID=66428 RepID=UPI00123A11BA|nr:transposase [Streptomyces parvus]KAA6202984.1 AAA family ATPase [Streptomyces parvus]
MSEPFARADQHRWGGVCLRGLPLDGGREPVEPVAARPGEDGNRQALARFVTSSPWDAAHVRARSAWRMQPVAGPRLRLIDDTGFLEDGDASACVARQCTGTTGKAANCRAGVSLHLASNGAWTAVNRRLFLPGSRDPASPKADPAAAARRDKCALPARVGHAEKRRPALGMIDRTRSRGIEVPRVIADRGYGHTAAFRSGPEERGPGHVRPSARPRRRPNLARPAPPRHPRPGRPPSAPSSDRAGPRKRRRRPEPRPRRPRAATAPRAPDRGLPPPVTAACRSPHRHDQALPAAVKRPSSPEGRPGGARCARFAEGRARHGPSRRTTASPPCGAHGRRVPAPGRAPGGPLCRKTNKRPENIAEHKNSKRVKVKFQSESARIYGRLRQHVCQGLRGAAAASCRQLAAASAMLLAGAVVARLVLVKDLPTLALVEGKCGSKQFGRATAHTARGKPLYALGHVRTGAARKLCRPVPGDPRSELLAGRQTPVMLVHRDEQLAHLHWAFRTCEKHGHGQVVLVTGAVGSGKTQVLETFGEWAANAGGQVLSAAGSRAEQGLHFGVLGQLLHSARVRPEEIGQVEELIREVALSVPASDAGRDTAAEILTESLTADGLWAPLLRTAFDTFLALAGRGPLVLAVDDLQHADAASLHCLLYVTRRLRNARIMVVLSEATTLHPAHPLFHAELRSLPRFARVSLPLLTLDSFSRLLGSKAGVLDVRGDKAGAQDIREEARRILRVTGGNPLLTQALFHEQANRETDSAPSTGARAGGTFDRAVLDCLYRHEPAVRRVAQALAVLNGPASQDLLGQLLDVLPDSIVPAVRALQGAGLISTGQLRHPRILHAVRCDIPAEERRRLHQRAAEMLHENGAEASVVAEHLVASAWTDGAWVAPVLRDAAAHALSSGRPDHAAACLRLGIRAETDEGRRNSLAAMMITARWQVNPLAVNGQVSRLVEAARTDESVPSTALAAVPYLLWQGRAEEAAEAISGCGADDHGPASDELRLNRLLLALSHPDHLRTVREDPGSWIRAAAAQHPGSPQLQAVSVLGNALMPADGADTVAAAEQLLEQHHPDSGSLGLLTAPLLALLCAGRSDRVAVWGGRLLARPGLQHTPAWRGVVRAIHAEAALRLGDLDVAERGARSALEDLPAPAWGVAVGGPLGTLITCTTESGRLFEADRWLRRPVPAGVFRTPVGAHYLIARGRHHLAVGQHQAASTDLHRCGELVRSWGIDVAALFPWRLELARVQLGLGNGTHAAQLLQEQLQVSHGLDDRTRGRALRLLASTAGPDHRRKLLSKAVTVLQSCRDQHELAHALSDTGQTLPRAGDPTPARLFVRRAGLPARTPALPQRTEEHSAPGTASTADAPPDPAQDGFEALDPDSLLSEAERRVAVLAARGRTNRQISNELYITVSTVEQHLTRVYRKLDVKSRTDLPNRLLALAEPMA